MKRIPILYEFDEFRANARQRRSRSRNAAALSPRLKRNIVLDNEL